jgi:hypothetical protein
MDGVDRSLCNAIRRIRQQHGRALGEGAGTGWGLPEGRDPFGLERLRRRRRRGAIGDNEDTRSEGSSSSRRDGDDYEQLLLFCVSSRGALYDGISTADEAGGDHWTEHLLRSYYPTDHLRAALICLAPRCEGLGRVNRCVGSLEEDRPFLQRVEDAYGMERFRPLLANLRRIPVFHFAEPCAKCGCNHAELNDVREIQLGRR